MVARLERHTPEGTENIVLVLERAEDAAGRLWVRVRLPVLPANTTGWVRRSALGGYGSVQTHLVVNRRRLTATLYRGGRPLFRAPVGVGSVRWPTPAGDFYIRNKLTRYESAFYGPLAFGTSARSAVLTDGPGRRVRRPPDRAEHPPGSSRTVAFACATQTYCGWVGYAGRKPTTMRETRRLPATWQPGGPPGGAGRAWVPPLATSSRAQAAEPKAGRRELRPHPLRS